ncbi:MAG: hypothetical protein C0621_09765 [Desulfuromonas sp.]|nr:MAG: hypothetical protein C0621_09765 [Desulfuromonas sp.]
MNIEYEYVEDGETRTRDIEIADTYENEYLKSRALDFHKTSTEPEFIRAANFLCEQIGYSESREDGNVTHMLTLVSDLYHCYCGYRERYLRVRMSKNDPKRNLADRYNRLGIKPYPLNKCLRGLLRLRYIERQKGYFNLVSKDGYLTRIRATEKLVRLLEDVFSVNVDMVTTCPQQELILRRTAPLDRKITYKDKSSIVKEFVIKVKYLEDYRDDEHTMRWRDKLNQYNELLANTYIDIDQWCFSYDEDKEIVIDLSDRTVRRSFSHSAFTKNGMFYGGFWQKLPEEIRDRIIIDGRHVVEVDFSGIMVHIIYAMKGLKLKELNRNPYIYAKDNDPDNKREYIKKLMNAALNIDESDGNGPYAQRSVMAVLDAVKKDATRINKRFPVIYSDYSDLMKKLWKMLREIKSYHSDVAGMFGTGTGIRTLFYDSQIAYKVINVMTNRRIPVLCIHDSFICAEQHVELLKEQMSKAFVVVLNQVSYKCAGTRNVTLEDVAMTQSSLMRKLPLSRTAPRAKLISTPKPVTQRYSTKHQRLSSWLSTKRIPINITFRINKHGIVSNNALSTVS